MTKRMKEEAASNAEADKKEKERIDKLNQADSMIFQTEKQLKDLGLSPRFFSGSPVSGSYHRLTLSLLHPAESLHHAHEVHQILLYQNLIISLQYQELQLLHIMQTFIVTV